MANISHAEGKVFLEGLWSQEDLVLAHRVMRAWEFYGEYGMSVSRIFGDLFQEGLYAEFTGRGRWSFTCTLPDFDEMTRDVIAHPAENAEPLAAETYDALLKVMYEKDLIISFSFKDELEEGGIEHGGGRFASDGRKLLYATRYDEQDRQIFRQKGGLLKYEGPGGDVVLDASVTRLGGASFNDRDDITSVVLPESLEFIAAGAFRGCSNLTDVTLSAHTRLNGNPFYDTPWSKSLGEFGIVNGVLISYQGPGGAVVIPEGVREINDEVFYECTALKSVVLPNSLRTIGNAAFCHCKALTAINFPAGLEEIGWNAFCGCTKLASVALPQPKGRVVRYDGYGRPSVKQAEFLGAGVFDSCRSLKRVDFSKEGRQEIPLWGFRSCSALEEVTLPENLCWVSAEGFKNCKKLKQIDLPDSVERIGREAFCNCASLTEFTVPPAVTRLEPGTFSKCASLQKVTLPDGLQYIGASTFAGCTALTSLTLPASVTEIYKTAFKGCENLTLYVPAGSYAEKFAKKYKIKFKVII